MTLVMQIWPFHDFHKGICALSDLKETYSTGLEIVTETLQFQLMSFQRSESEVVASRIVQFALYFVLC